MRELGAPHAQSKSQTRGWPGVPGEQRQTEGPARALLVSRLPCIRGALEGAGAPSWSDLLILGNTRPGSCAAPRQAQALDQHEPESEPAAETPTLGLASSPGKGGDGSALQDGRENEWAVLPAPNAEVRVTATHRAGRRSGGGWEARELLNRDPLPAGRPLHPRRGGGGQGPRAPFPLHVCSCHVSSTDT